MTMLFVVGALMLLNAAISFWNARVAGMIWAESRALGGFVRFMVWCAAIMSAIGFSSVILPGLVFGAAALLEPEQGQALVKFTMSLWYLLVIFPVLSIGLIFMINSWIEAYRNPGLLNMGFTAWNTFSQVHNTMGAIRNLGPVFREVMGPLGSVLSGRGDPRAKIVVLGIVLVALSLLLGALLTAIIIKRYEGTLPLPERDMAQA